jgi:3-phosphoshikimate 1-carboxyvinyltransferase
LPASCELPLTSSHDLVVIPNGGPLAGSVPLPSDDRIAPLAVLCAALAEEPSEIAGGAWGEGLWAMAEALGRLGVGIDIEPTQLRVRGVSIAGLSAPVGPLVCGGGPTTMRLLAGVLVAQPFASELVAGEGGRDVDMQSVAKPLRWRGGQIEGVFSPAAPSEILPPLAVGPLPSGVVLSELEYDLAPFAADVKGAVLFSGLYADGPTWLREPLVSCDHAERLLQALEVPVSTAGSVVEIDPEGWTPRLPGVRGRVAGDPSAAALLLAAAALVPRSRVCTRQTCLNPTRIGALHLLRQMGGQIEWEIQEHGLGEAAGMACASHAPLRAISMTGETASRAADDVAVLAALAARAEGTSVLDRALFAGDVARQLCAALREFGVDSELSATGLAIEGRPAGNFRAADLDARDAPTLGALGILLGMLGQGPTRVRRVDGFARRFPRIVGTLRALGADLRVEERTLPS